MHDHSRILYFANYTSEMQRAIAEDGCDVRGYFAWSLLDNFDTLLLTIDELIDGGMIMESDAAAITNRVGMKGAEGVPAAGETGAPGANFEGVSAPGPVWASVAARELYDHRGDSMGVADAEAREWEQRFARCRDPALREVPCEAMALVTVQAMAPPQ